MKNSIIILGAGASFESGVPTQNNFISEALKIADSNSDLRYYPFYSNIIKKFQKIYHNNNIESIYNVADLLTRFPFIDLNAITNPEDGIMNTASLRPASYIQEAVQFLIVITLKSKCKNLKEIGFNAYKNLISNFTGDIITFNWDNIIEQAFHSMNKKFSLGWEESSEEVNIFKLHGSIDWNHNPNEEDLKIYIDESLTQKTIWELRENEESEFIPILIFPNYSKSDQLDTLGNLMYQIWGNASNKISNADKIIFIGYSLPITDLDSKLLFQYSLTKNTNKNLEIIVVDPYIDKNLKVRYKEIVQNLDLKNPIRFIRAKFSELVYNQL